MDFSSALKKEQNRLSLKQAELADLLFGVPLRTLQSWLHGEKYPPAYYQKIILHYLAQQVTGEERKFGL